jgi:hypothetical protein
LGWARPKPDFDARGPRATAKNKPNQVSSAQTAQLEKIKKQAPDLEARWSESTDAPSRLTSTTRPLTAESSAEPRSIAVDFLKSRLDLFRLSPDDARELRFARESRSRHTGTSHLTLQQQLNGIDVFGAAFAVNVNARGQVLSVGGELFPIKRQRTDATQPAISSVRALELAAVDADAWNSRAVGTPKLVYFPADNKQLILAWDVTFDDLQTGFMYRSLVGASEGSVLWRKSLTQLSHVEAHGEVYTRDSPLPNFPAGTAPPAPLLRTDVPFNGLTFFAHEDPHADWWAGAPATTTVSNNVSAQEDRDGNNSGGLQPTAGAGGNFTFPVNLTQDPSTYQDAAIVNLFYWVNRLHDILYRYGFDEASGNFQTDNFGLGGAGGDPVQADAQDNRDGMTPSLCNANFSTPGDGTSGRMQMFQCDRAPGAERDGDFDNHVIAHEFVHGVSNRLISGLGDSQGGGMGEGWSDWVGLAILAEPADDLFGNYRVGEWLFGFGIRRQPYSTNQSVFTRTYGDIVDSARCTVRVCSNDPAQTCTQNTDCTGGTCTSTVCAEQNECQPPVTTINQGNCVAEVHDTGEIWAEALWIARANLIWKYGWETGNGTILQLVIDGMKLSPPSPDFVDARNAILQADVALTGGANSCLLWDAFTRMGLGTGAVTSGPTDVSPIESFSRPSTCAPTATVSPSLTFGSTCSGASSSGDIVVSNTGSGELLVRRAFVAGSSAISIVGPITLPVWATAGADIRIPVRCAPPFPGTHNAVIRIETGDPAHPTFDVPVSCSAPAPDIRVTAAAAFGNVCAGTEAQKGIEVCNVGACSLEVDSVAFGAACPDFTLNASSFPASLSSGACASATVSFTPTSAGPKSCSVEVTSNDPDSPLVTVNTSANTPFGTISVDPDQAFLPTAIAGTSGVCKKSQPFAVTNAGSCPVKVNSVEVTAGASEFGFSGLPPTPASIAPAHLLGDGGLNTVFTPTALGRARAGTVTVTYESDGVAHTTSSVSRALCGEGVREGARILVTAGGVPVPMVESIQLQRMTGNRNSNQVDTVSNDKNLALQTVNPTAPCKPFSYHREYGTVSNPIQLASGSYTATATAMVSGKRKKKTVAFSIESCSFNPTVVVAF